MGLFKKLKKLVKKSVKFQGKLITAPLKFAKKNPGLTAAIVGATFAGGLPALGKKLAGGLAKKYGVSSDGGPAEQIGEGVAGGGGDFVDPGLGTGQDVSAPVEGGFASGLPPGALAIGGLGLLAVVLSKGGK